MDQLQNETELDNRTTVTSSVENNSVQDKIESVIDENDKNILRNLLLNKKIDEEDKNIKLIEENSAITKSNDYLNDGKNISVDVGKNIALKEDKEIELRQEQQDESICSDFETELEKNTDENTANTTENTNNESNLIESVGEKGNEQKICEPPDFFKDNLQNTTHPESISNDKDIKMDVEIKSVANSPDSANLISNNSESELNKDNLEEKINQDVLQACIQINEKNCKEIVSDSTTKNIPNTVHTSSTELNYEAVSTKLNLKYCDNTENSAVKLTENSKSIDVESLVRNENENKCSSDLNHSNIIKENSVNLLEETNTSKQQSIESEKNNNLNFQNINVESDEIESVKNFEKAATLKEYLSTDNEVKRNSIDFLYSHNEIGLNSTLSTSLSDNSRTTLTDTLSKTHSDESENLSSNKNSVNLSNDSIEDLKRSEISQSSKIPSESTPKKSPVKNYLISPTISKFNQPEESSCDSNSSSNLVIDQEWDQRNPLKRKLSPPRTNGENSPNAKHFHFDLLSKNNKNTNTNHEILNNINSINTVNQEENKMFLLNNSKVQPIQNVISNSDSVTIETDISNIKSSINQIAVNNKNQDSGKFKIYRNESGKFKTNNKKTPRKRKKTKTEFINNLAVDLISQNINQQIPYQSSAENLGSEEMFNAQRSIYSIQNSQIRGDNYPAQLINQQQIRQPYHQKQTTDQQKNKPHPEYHNSIIQSQQLHLPNKIFESPQKNISTSNVEASIQQQQQQPLLNYQLIGQQFLPSNSTQSYQSCPLLQNHLQSFNSVQSIENNSFKPLLNQNSDSYYHISANAPTAPQFQMISQMIHQVQPNSIKPQIQPMGYSQPSYQQPIYQYQIAPELPMQLIEEPPSHIVQYKCFRCLTACFQTIQELQEHQQYCLFRDKMLQSSQNNQVQSAYTIVPSENQQFNGNNSGKLGLLHSNEIENHYNIENRKKSLHEQKTKFFLCSACGTYHQDWNLFLHMRKIHKKYICLYCMGLFPTGQHLTKHLETKHNLEKNYFNSQFELLKSCKGSSYFLMCSNCEYIFNENDDFYEHICAEFMQPCLQCRQKGENNNTFCRCKSNTINNIGTKKSKKNKSQKFNNSNQKYSKSKSDLLDKSNIPLNTNTEQIDSDDGGNYLEHFNYNDNDLINLYKSNRNLLKQKQEQKQQEEFLVQQTDQFDESTTNETEIGVQEEKNESLVVPKIKLIIPKEYQNKPAIESEESSTESEKGDDSVITKSTIDEENVNNDEIQKQNVRCESKNDSDMDIDITCNTREQFVSQQLSSVEIETIQKESLDHELPNDGKMSDSEIQLENSKSFVNNTEDTVTELMLPEEKSELISESTSIETATYKPETSDTILETNKAPDIEEKPKVTEKPKPADGIELADDDYAVQELSLEAPLDKIPMVQFLRICLRATHPVCLYCYHARRIAVNGNSLALHLLAQHRFSATVDSITAEELQPQTIISKLKSFLLELNDYYFNMETYSNITSNEDVKLTKVVDESQFECFQCRFVTKIHKELYVHNRKMHLRTAILCYMCRSNFYSYSEILCHICPGAPNKQIIFDIKFRCCLCELDNISSAFRLMVHLRKKHLACDVCLEFCYDQSRLSSHVWKHKLHHLCYRCGIAYRNKPDITKHLFWKHGTESVLCRRCLQKRWPHVYHFCIPPSTFVCEICQLTFSRAMYLKVHKRIHSGEEPYPCTEDNCDKKFISRKLLLKHVDGHSAAPPLKVIEENKQDSDADMRIESTVEVAKKEEKSKKECSSKEKEKHESKEKTESSSKKKKKKSKREPKELLADLNLQAPNLSESGSSDSDSDNDSISKKTVKEPVLIQAENEFVPSVMLSPASEVGDDEAGSSDQKNENQDKALDIWKNFEQFQATQKSQSLPDTSDNKMILEPLAPVLRAVQSDHDYCITFKPNNEKIENENKNSEKEDISIDPKKFDGLTEFIKFDVNMEPSIKSKKEKSPKKHHESGNDTDSSSSNSSSDSDSSCSCGSNCSCSSGSSSSSSHSSSSTDSDDSASSSQEKKKSSSSKRAAREERRNKRKEEETIKNSSTEIVDVVTNDILPTKLEPIILESDLDTEESDTDEDFYDEHPQKLANEMLAEKRRQLMQQMSPSHQNNFDIVENSRPSTPSLPGEEMAKEKRSKGKKKKRKTSSKGILGPIKLNGSEIMDRKQIMEFSQNSLFITSTQTNQSNIAFDSGVSEAQLLPPPLPATQVNHNVISNMSFSSQPGQIYHNRLSTESSSDAGVVGSTTNSLKRSKRARRPNRFYGYSSDDDHHHHSVPNLYSGALKPTPPPQFKWSKEDLPSPSKSILSHKNHKTSLSGKKAGASRISKKKENSTNKLKMKLSKTIGSKILPPIPTLKIRPSDIFPQIPPSPLDYQPPRPRPQPEKPQPPQYNLNTGPIVQSVVHLPPVPIHHIETVPNKLFDTSGTGEEDDDDSTSSDDDKLTIPVTSHQKPPKEKKANKPNVAPLELMEPSTPQPKEQEAKIIPPALLPNPDYLTIQYFKRNNIRYPIRPPAGARAPREGESVYCYCRCPYDEVSEMIACDGNNCMIEWFHFECVGILLAPQGKWYCAECKAKLNSAIPAGPPTASAASLKFEYFNR